MGLDRSIQFLKGIGPKKANVFKKVGIETVGDLLTYYPKDITKMTNINQQTNLSDKEKVILNGKIAETPFLKKVRKGLSFITTTISTDSGKYKIVIFNRPFLLNKLKLGSSVTIEGTYNKQYNQITVSDVKFKEISLNQAQEDGQTIVPVYKSTEDLSQKNLRETIGFAVESFLHFVKEPLPKEFLDRFNLDDIQTAIRNIHFPKDEDTFFRARYRFMFEELVIFQGALLYSKKQLEGNNGHQHLFDYTHIKTFIDGLPFTLTNDQKKVIAEVLTDLKSIKPMNRLVQGDVGSGKTIVAAIALLACAISGGQGVLLVPTEILAEQHYINLKKFLPQQVSKKIILLTASTKNKEDVYRQISMGEGSIIIGTHAILQEKVEFFNLSLIVTDEQHRFGVKQRAALRQKGQYPDVLVMSATPIPRTLSQVLYGDLDVSIIKQMPLGRKPILTYSVTPRSRDKVYDFITKEIEKGRQCYIICPLVEESEKVQGESAITYHQEIQEIFKDTKVGLLHGQMKSKDKDEVMLNFKDGKYSILVSTTVVEVGVDVPNSTVMVIENAERFGLAQLHQLRGRVGRSSLQSYCILVCHSNSELTKKRMAVMTSTTDGFKISEEDLKLRGPGEFFGVRQHGLPEFKYFNLLLNIDEVPKAKEAANFLLEQEKQNKYKVIFQRIIEFYQNNLD